MTARKRSLPSLDDAGRMVFELCYTEQGDQRLAWNELRKEVKRHYVKLALEIWRAVDKCV